VALLKGDRLEVHNVQNQRLVQSVGNNDVVRVMKQQRSCHTRPVHG